MDQLIESLEYLYDDAYEIKVAIQQSRNNSESESYDKMILRRVSRNMDKIVPLIKDALDEIEKLR